MTETNDEKKVKELAAELRDSPGGRKAKRIAKELEEAIKRLPKK